MKRAGVIIIFVIFVLASRALALDSFRCGADVVMNGDSTARVLMYCGPPSYTEIINPGIEGPRIENWYYNCGSNGFLYVLRFVQGDLESIRQEGYGTGKSDCTGAANR